ncbi:hypothetical protein SAMN04515695_2209 [Pseudovibrio sp. Tun.PSC04-5.I4]|nr:hypothetical protein SAMN04515695_2209 [Pseudovibrio sp. Tun.PSC04-5.I4]
MNVAKITVKELGRAQIQERLGVQASAVSMAISHNRFPAAWFNEMEKLACAKGASLDRSLFNWKKAKADGGPVRQEGDHVPSA